MNIGMVQMSSGKLL